MGGAWTGGGNGEAKGGGGIESEHGADTSETSDGQRPAGNSRAKATASGIAGSGDGVCGMSGDCRASGASIRAAVGTCSGQACTGDRGAAAMAENLGKCRDPDSEAAQEGFGSMATSSGGDRGA